MQTALATLATRAPARRPRSPHRAAGGDLPALVGVAEFEAHRGGVSCRASASDVRAVIIAAGSGKSLLPLTEDRPKCMLDIKGRTRSWSGRSRRSAPAVIQDIAVVRGYRKDAGHGVPGVTLLRQRRASRRPASWHSLFAAAPELQRAHPVPLRRHPVRARAAGAAARAPTADVRGGRGPRVGGPARPAAARSAKPIDLVVTEHDPPPPGRRALGDGCATTTLVTRSAAPCRRRDAPPASSSGMALFSASAWTPGPAERIGRGAGRRAAATSTRPTACERAAFTDLAAVRWSRGGEPVSLRGCTCKGWLDDRHLRGLSARLGRDQSHSAR